MNGVMKRHNNNTTTEMSLGNLWYMYFWFINCLKCILGV